MRFFGRILAILGILALVGLVSGAAYGAGLAASGVAHPDGYGYGFAFVGFGFLHFVGFILFVFLLVALLRFAFGGGRGWGGRGQMGGWSHGPGPAGWSQSSGDPREAWIRGRLEDWHRTAHGGETAPPAPSAGPGPTSTPPA